MDYEEWKENREQRKSIKDLGDRLVEMTKKCRNLRVDNFELVQQRNGLEGEISWLKSSVTGMEETQKKLYNEREELQKENFDLHAHLNKIITTSLNLSDELDRSKKELAEREGMLDELIERLVKITWIEPIKKPEPEPVPAPKPEGGFFIPGKTLLRFSPSLDNPARWSTKHYVIAFYEYSGDYRPQGGFQEFPKPHYRAYVYHVSGLADGSRLPTLNGQVEFETFQDAVKACSEHFWANRGGSLL